MRALVVVLITVAGCGGGGVGSGGGGGDGGGGSGGGGGGDNSSVECRQASSAFHSIVDFKQSCTADSDCRVILDGCFGPDFCAVYVNNDNAAAAGAALADGQKACQCGVCNAPLPPACVDGACGSAFDLCRSLDRQMAAIAAANQSCTQDADCSFVDGVDDCNTFTNATGQAQMMALADRFAANRFCHACAPKTPRCTNGSCAAP